MTDEEPPLLFRARIDIGPYDYKAPNGEDKHSEGAVRYGSVREDVSVARGDATRDYNRLSKYSFGAKHGAKLEKHLEACIADWRVVE